MHHDAATLLGRTRAKIPTAASSAVAHSTNFITLGGRGPSVFRLDAIRRVPFGAAVGSCPDSPRYFARYMKSPGRPTSLWSTHCGPNPVATARSTRPASASACPPVATASA